MVTEPSPSCPAWAGAEEGGDPVCKRRGQAQVRKMGGEPAPRKQKQTEAESLRKPQGGGQIHTQRKKLLHTLGGKRQTGQIRGRTAKESS